MYAIITLPKTEGLKMITLTFKIDKPITYETNKEIRYLYKVGYSISLNSKCYEIIGYYYDINNNKHSALMCDIVWTNACRFCDSDYIFNISGLCEFIEECRHKTQYINCN